MNPINPAASGDSTSPRNVYQVVTEQIIRQLAALRSEEHTSELQSRLHLVCRLLLEKKNDYTDSNDVSRAHVIKKARRAAGILADFGDYELLEEFCRRGQCVWSRSHHKKFKRTVSP